MLRVISLSLFVLISGCTYQDSVHRDVSARDFAENETSFIAAGVLDIAPEEYPKLVDRAASGDSTAIQQVQRVTGHGDGAGFQGQTGLLQKLLMSIGDEVFARALEQQPIPVILKHSYLRNPRNEVALTKERFPLTSAVITNAEQGASSDR